MYAWSDSLTPSCPLRRQASAECTIDQDNLDECGRQKCHRSIVYFVHRCGYYLGRDALAGDLMATLIRPVRVRAVSHQHTHAHTHEHQYTSMANGCTRGQPRGPALTRASRSRGTHTHTHTHAHTHHTHTPSACACSRRLGVLCERHRAAPVRWPTRAAAGTSTFGSAR